MLRFGFTLDATDIGIDIGGNKGAQSLAAGGSTTYEDGHQGL
jgi:hypothetical protein